MENYVGGVELLSEPVKDELVRYLYVSGLD
jgi:hypothetical protein